MKRFFTILAIAFVMCPFVEAQPANDRFRKQFDDFRQRANSGYNDFRSQCNKSYADFLRLAWASYNSIRVEKPKDEPLPPVSFDDLPIKDNAVVIKDTVKSMPVLPRPKPVEPLKVAPTPDAVIFSFKFYGEEYEIRADKSKMFHLPSISENDVADAWSELSDAGYECTVEDLLEIRDTRNYCDWLYLQLVYSFASAFTADENEATVLSAWLLCQSGYKARVARAEKELCFLFGSDYTIYGANCFNIDGEKFYCMNCKASYIKIADACRFPKEQGVSFAMESQPSFGGEYSPARTFKSAKYKTACVSGNVNNNLLKFLASYPDTQYGDNFMTRWAMYAETPMDSHCREMMYPSLKKAIDGKSEKEAVNILLNFVQTAFKYEYDEKVWGYDRIFFAEETLHYDYCDCEDRSILFSRLVRDLLGLDVALVYYPNHLATAVRFNSDVAGDYFVTEDGRFTVCDPTYIGAPAGATMKGMKGKEATLIQLKR